MKDVGSVMVTVVLRCARMVESSLQGCLGEGIGGGLWTLLSECLAGLGTWATGQGWSGLAGSAVDDAFVSEYRTRQGADHFPNTL